jgi:hypothetical protein
MNRRQIISLPLLAALPLSSGLDPVRPVLVDRNGNLLDFGSFPTAGVWELQRHLDWLHQDPEYFLRIDFPIQYVGEAPEEESRIIPVEHELDYKVPVVTNYRVVDPGQRPEVLGPEGAVLLPVRPYLDRLGVGALQGVLDDAKADPKFIMFTNYPIRCTDPHLQARLYVFDNFSAEEVEAQRDAFDEWAGGPMEPRVYA